MSTKKLRIGFIIDQNPSPLWQYFVIEKVSQLDFCELCQINQINTINNEKNLKKSIFQTLLINYEQNKITQNNSSFGKKDLFAFSKFLHIFEDFILDNELIIDLEKKIETSRLDLIINFSSLKMKGKIITLSKFGIWNFNSNSTVIHDLIGFNEILNDFPIITTNLQCIIGNEKNEKIIAQCYSPTNFLSLRRSTDVMNWNKSKILLLSLEKLNDFNELPKFVQNKIMFINNINLNEIPNGYQYIKLFFKMIEKSIKAKIYNKFYFDQWILMFNYGPQLSTSFSKFQSLKPQKDRFWADPHIVYENNQYYIFFEEFLYAQNKGHIALLQIDKNGNIQNSKKILEKSYHLSYPFVFKFNNTYYMIPETHANHTIELYECIDFPYSWKFSKNLMKNIDAVDTTLFYDKDKWWLFTSISKYNQIKTWDDLFLFYTDDLINGSWKSHPCNPIISDLRKARSAGKIFLQDKNIIRPSQDNSLGYGSGISLNKIHLDEENYNETVLEILRPNWNSQITGLHTIQFDSGLTIIDAKMKRMR